MDYTGNTFTLGSGGNIRCSHDRVPVAASYRVPLDLSLQCSSPESLFHVARHNNIAGGYCFTHTVRFQSPLVFGLGMGLPLWRRRFQPMADWRRILGIQKREASAWNSFESHRRINRWFSRLGFLVGLPARIGQVDGPACRLTQTADYDYSGKGEKSMSTQISNAFSFPVLLLTIVIGVLGLHAATAVALWRPSPALVSAVAGN